VTDLLSNLWAAVNAEPRWLSVLGQTLDALGALVIISSVVASRRHASKVAGFRPPEETRIGIWDEDAHVQLDLPPPSVVDHLRQSKFAVTGGFLLVLGFLLQIGGTWPR